MSIADLDPLERPLLDPWPEVGEMLGMKRSAVYTAIARGDLPSIRINGHPKVVSALLLNKLGITA